MQNKMLVSDRVHKIDKSAIHEMTSLSKEIEDVAFLSWANKTSFAPNFMPTVSARIKF